MMMMIAFITSKSSLVPFVESLCAQVQLDYISLIFWCRLVRVCPSYQFLTGPTWWSTCVISTSNGTVWENLHMCRYNYIFVNNTMMI